MELYALIFQIIECIGIFFVNIFDGCKDFFQSAVRQYRIGNMPIVNKQVKFLTTQCIGTFASAYTKGYALN